MSDIAAIKDQLIDEMWLPIAREAGKKFRPHQMINKKMKVLTLTNDKNFREVIELVRNKITKKDLIYGWHKARLTAYRLDSEGKMATVFPGMTYEDSVETDTHEIRKEFPFDIINLDFSSQNPETVNGRIEKEICSVEKTIKLQVGLNVNGMALIYTTILDSANVSMTKIKSNSDGINIKDWPGLQIDGILTTVSQRDDKTKCLKNVFEQFINKYSCENIRTMEIHTKNLPNGSGSIYSLAVILKKV